MDNFKILDERLLESSKVAEQAHLSLNDLDAKFKTLDCQVNAARTELMKLQFEKNQYTM